MLNKLLKKSAFFFILTIIFVNGRINLKKKFKENVVNVLIKNELRELRIAYKGILVLETSAFQNSSYELSFRQITNGRDLIQLIIQNGLVKDCEYSKEAKQILHFVDDFSKSSDVFTPKDFEKGDVFALYKTGNASQGNSAIHHFKHRSFLNEFRSYVKIRRAERLCNKLVEETLEGRGEHFEYIRIEKRNRKENGAEKRNVQKTQNTEGPFLPPRVIEGGVRNFENSPTTSETQHHIRKRSPINRLLMFPGTKWCGRGQTALHYNDIGEDKEADVCCRDHDCCPDIIPSFSARFNLFNFRFHAVLHCDCDNRFRFCLKQSYSPMASLIGRIYFNIMGSKCFTLHEESVCAERSWWGYCLKYEEKPVAKIKSQDAFEDV